jgi:hypothetical protein
MKRFARAIDVVESLSLEEQEELVRTVQHRIAERLRLQIVGDVRAAAREHRSGRIKPASVDAIMAAARRPLASEVRVA